MLLQGLIAVAPTAPLSSFVVILIIKVINLPYDLKNHEYFKQSNNKVWPDSCLYVKEFHSVTPQFSGVFFFFSFSFCFQHTTYST